MKKAPHIIWVCPTNQLFFRSKGEIKPRPGSVIPKLVDQGIKLDVLIPHDPSLLPKSKLSPARITKHDIKFSQNYTIEIIKLTRGTSSPGVFMAKLPSVEAPVSYALFSQAGLALARQLNKPIDVFHVFGWEVSLLPLYLELGKSSGKVFAETRTFLTISSLRNQGNFSPGLLNYINIPKELFHPEAIEFFGKISFLKAGLVFADGIGVVDEYLTSRGNKVQKNGTGLEGILDSISFKLRRWASDRSVRSYLEAYRELLLLKKTSSLLPHLRKKLHSSKNEAQAFIESWGPVPQDRYQTNTISFLQQSPKKAYVFWEWVGSKHSNYGIVLEDIDSGNRILVDHNLSSLGDYWLDVQPGRTYVVELTGAATKGTKTLLRSQPLFIPRDHMSSNTEAVFVDVKTNVRTTVRNKEDWSKIQHKGGDGTSAWEWATNSLGHSRDLGNR